MEPKHTRNRLKETTGPLLIITAALIDSIQAFLGFIGVGVFLNWILTFFAWILFYIWFKLLNIDFFDNAARKAITLWGAALIEIIPIINVLPAWTLSVILMTLIVKKEDARYNKKALEQHSLEKPNYAPHSQ